MTHYLRLLEKTTLIIPNKHKAQPDSMLFKETLSVKVIAFNPTSVFECSLNADSNIRSDPKLNKIMPSNFIYVSFFSLEIMP